MVSERPFLCLQEDSRERAVSLKFIRCVLWEQNILFGGLKNMNRGYGNWSSFQIIYIIILLIPPDKKKIFIEWNRNVFANQTLMSHFHYQKNVSPSKKQIPNLIWFENQWWLHCCEKMIPQLARALRKYEPQSESDWFMSWYLLYRQMCCGGQWNIWLQWTQIWIPPSRHNNYWVL